MAYLRQEIIAKVIPRLLRPLETEGRSVIPQLVHGDLWDGNTAVDAVTEKPLIFDACSSYAHHECKSTDNFCQFAQANTQSSRRVGAMATYAP
jgi:fructosamine-3-kinase